VTRLLVIAVVCLQATGGRVSAVDYSRDTASDKVQRVIHDQSPDPLDDVIVWSPSRRLDWSDFKAKPPSDRLGGG